MDTNYRKIERDSNIEILRILAMFMVLALHANFTTFGVPSKNTFFESPWPEGVRIFVESLCCVAVNVYVFLSGWYGIRFKWKRLFEFLFQVLFFVVIGAIIGIIRHNNISDVLFSGVLLMEDSSYWFVKSYFLLYVLSPVLESYVEVTNKHNFKALLILFFIFEFVYGFGRGCSWFGGGYTTIHFIGLYLLSRYCNLYYSDNFKNGLYVGLTSYLGFSLLTTFLFIVPLLFYDLSWTGLFNYDSPLMIFGAMALVLSFHKMKVKRTHFINAVAASSFAVYLLHTNPFIFDFYLNFVKELSLINWQLVLLFLPVVFITAIIIDRLRLVVWYKIINRL